MCAITTEPNAKSTTEMILITGSTTNQQTSSTPVPSTSTSSDSFNFQTTTTTTTTTIASTSIVVESSTGTIGPTAAEPSLTQPAVPDNVALIAGAVGGSLCALLLIVVVVALLWRQRSRNDRREDSSGIDLPTSGTVATPSQSEYHAMPMLDANYDVGNLSTELTT